MSKRKTTLDIISTNTKYLRTIQGLTQAELGAKAGVVQSYIRKIEREACNMSVDKAEALAKALGVSAGDFMSRDLAREAKAQKKAA